jgi:hypothetical protein
MKTFWIFACMVEDVVEISAIWKGLKRRKMMNICAYALGTLIRKKERMWRTVVIVEAYILRFGLIMCPTFGNVTKDFKYISKSVKYLHETNQKSLFNSLAKFMLQFGKKNDELYPPPTMLCSLILFSYFQDVLYSCCFNALYSLNYLIWMFR